MKNLILLGEYGSVAQGTATPDSDHDYMGIYVETEEQVIGLETAKSSRDSDAAEGEKSAPGSSDTTYHTLRNYAKLAAAGNPTIHSTMFLPEYATLTDTGQGLLDIRDAFLSKRVGYAYLGYMDAQIKAFNETGRKNRVELVEKYGYDIKFAYHAYRLGVQGYYTMEDGEPLIPLTGWHLDFARNIRDGIVPKDRVMAELETVRTELKNALDSSTLPDYADTNKINKFLIDAHQDVWKHGII